MQERVGREKMWGENEKIQKMGVGRGGGGKRKKVREGVGRGGGGKRINELKVATVCTNF